MYDYISGKLTWKSPTNIVIENNGVGYHLKISLSTYNDLPEIDENIKLKTYLHVREDILQLYGFSSGKERDVFTTMISISGVGPKLAQTVLSGLATDELILAVKEEDEITLTRISGVGKKTAQRLVIELRDKFIKYEPESVSKKAESRVSLNELENEAILALMSLGYARNSAEKAIVKIRQKENINSVEQILKAALQIV